MYLTGQLEGVSEDRSVLGHLERVPVRPTFHFSGFFFFLPISQFLPNAHKEQKILGEGDLTLFISPTKKKQTILMLTYQ